MHAVDYGRSQVYRLPLDDLRHGISDPLIIPSTVAYAAPAPLIPLFPRRRKRDETIPVGGRARFESPRELVFAPLDKCPSLPGTFISHIVKISLTHRWRSLVWRLFVRADAVSAPIPIPFPPLAPSVPRAKPVFVVNWKRLTYQHAELWLHYVLSPQWVIS